MLTLTLSMFFLDPLSEPVCPNSIPEPAVRQQFFPQPPDSKLGPHFYQCSHVGHEGFNIPPAERHAGVMDATNSPPWGTPHNDAQWGRGDQSQLTPEIP